MLLTSKLRDRLEASSREILMDLAMAARTVVPDAEFVEVAGASICYTGRGSPFTKAVCRGSTYHPSTLDEVDAYFEGKADNWEFVTDPFTPVELLRQLAGHGYYASQFEGTLSMEVTQLPEESKIEIEVCPPSHREWAMTSLLGWMDSDAEEVEPDETARILSAQTAATRYLARIDGAPAGAACLLKSQGFYFMAGACTRPQFRRKGVQSALYARRLRDAGLGARAFVSAIPGSESYRNAQRLGFEPVYTSLVWFRRLGT